MKGEDGLWHTAYRSFEYIELGNTGTKVAAVNGISHPVVRGGKMSRSWVCVPSVNTLF